MSKSTSINSKERGCHVALDNISVSADFTQEDGMVVCKVALSHANKFFLLFMTFHPLKECKHMSSCPGRNPKPCGSCQSGSSAGEVTKWKGEMNASLYARAMMSPLRYVDCICREQDRSYS